MIKQNKIKKVGKKLALFEILIIITGFIAVAYLISDRLQLVSAAITLPAIPIPEDLIVESISNAAPLGFEGLDLGIGAFEVNGPVTINTGFNFWKFLGSQATNILFNAAIAAALYWGVNALGNLFWPGDPEIAEQLALAVSIGYGAGTALSMILGAIPGIGTAGFWGGGIAVGSLFTISWLGLVGIGTGLIIWFFAGTDYKVVSVMYSCNKWQAPIGGADCNKCNQGSLRCTEYKCTSLGQGCELVNKGTSEEACIYVNRTDVTAPDITPLNSVLKTGFTYTPDKTRSPPDEGVIIKYTGVGADADGCVPPYTPIYYGVNLSERAICRLDRERQVNFSEMNLLASKGNFLQEHIFVDFYPSLAAAEYEGLNISGDGTYETHIRCQDANGNSNVGTFAFKYCIQKTPDITPPSIKLTNPLNNMPVAKGQESKEVEVYTDKPSLCKWSKSDKEFDSMESSMVCASSITEVGANMLYKCKTNLTGLVNEEENVFYFKCKSYPALTSDKQYTMATSYKYTLKGTRELAITSLLPEKDSTVVGSTQEVNVKLQVETAQGYSDGLANCYYKEKNSSESSYVLFKDTNSHTHTQNLWLDAGTHKYDVKCIDLGGNVDIETTEFKVETDTEPPMIIRMYNEGGDLKFITDENAQCVYGLTDCSYAFEDGIALTTTDGREHYLSIEENGNFYIKCEDSLGIKPLAEECTLIARPL